MTLTKTKVIAALITELERQLSVAKASAEAAYQGATDSESKAENKYDTRGLEASYLAHGQSKRVLELESAIGQYRRLLTQSQLPSQPTKSIGQNSLVRLVNEQASSASVQYFYIGPAGGGIRLNLSQQLVHVISVDAPVAIKLIGKELDDEIELTQQGKTDFWLIDAIS